MNGANENGARRNGARSATERITYCIVPRELAPKLHDTLRDHFRDNPSVRVVVERRRGERRKAERRRAEEAEPSEVEERRRIRSVCGRRVADRRATTVPVEPPPLPRKARRYADRLVFVERLEPSDQEAMDIEANRLILRYQGGDESALVDLYLRYFNNVYGYARVALRDHHEAEDVTQQVFTNVIDAIPRYEVQPDKPLRAWLLRIARNSVLDVVRHRQRFCVEDPEQLARLEGESDVETLGVLNWLSDRDVTFFVERLPAAQREVLVLRYMLDLSSEEIANVLGRTPAGVRKLHTRAVRTLEQRLASVGRKDLRSRRIPTLIRIKPAPVLAARRFALASGFTPAGRLWAASSRLRGRA